MARLRFHFPWGPSFTAIGYALMAAAAAWFLSTDLHGHLWLRSALHAAAAVPLGVIAWRVSDRLTDWVNLHTSPFLRLALPGAGALVLATYATGGFCELAVGADALWPELLCPFLFFLVALAPTLSGVVLLAGLETAQAARRGGNGVREALGPMWRYLLVGLVLAAATGFAAVELPTEIQRVGVALAPDVVRKSGWLEREKRLFQEVYRGASCEVLVAPFAAREPSVDRPARALMMRYVAAELASRSELCVADPTLVMRALGTRARSTPEAEVRALAELMNASWVLHGTVSRDPVRLALTVQLRMDRRSAPQTWMAGQETTWGPIEFSDELPPEAAFDLVVPEVVATLGVGLNAASHEPTGPASAAVPPTVAALVAESGSPLARARGLQLLAATHHPSEVAGEHLWERSLLALRPLPSDDPDARLLRARAALHLHRRPYAVWLLQGLGTPEAQALNALAQGNLAFAVPLTREVRDSMGSLTLALELEALRGRYGKLTGQPERRQQLLDSYPGLAALLYRSMATADADVGPSLDLIAKQLRADGVEVPSAPLQAIAGRVGLSLPASTLSLAGDLERSRATTWRTHATAWRGEQAYDRLAAWDAPDALFAAARGAITDAGRAMAEAGTPASVLAWAAGLGNNYAGYPPVSASVAVGLQRGAGDAAPLMAARARRLPAEVLAWEGGESDTERVLRSRIAAALPAAAPDEPPRPWRAPIDGPDAPLALKRQQIYAQDDFAALETAMDALERAGQGELARRLGDDARLRFVGSAARERFLLRRAERSGNLSEYASVLQERIREQPEDWPAHVELARVYLSARQPAYAQQILFAYPGATLPPTDAAATERLQEAAAILLGVGEADLARPFAERAAAGVESAARGWARLDLALMDHNWQQVRTHALDLHERYAAPGALARAASVSFLLGENDTGWRAFYEAAKRFEDFEPWDAALDGHRIESTRPEDLIAFASRWKSLSEDRAREARLKGYFLFNSLLLDRAPSDPLVRELTDFARKRNSPELEALTSGYVALKRNEYAAAADHLLSLYDPRAAEPYVLPYLVVALLQAGRADEARGLIAAAHAQAPRAFHTLLARAYLLGTEGRVDDATQLLWEAFVAMPPRTQGMVPPGFELLDLSERLFLLSGDSRYRTLLADVAARQQRNWPVSWAYAFVARYAQRPEEAAAALGMAQFLDPGSERLREFGHEQRDRALARYTSGNPFKG